jgi:2-iminoacetate synthase
MTIYDTLKAYREFPFDKVQRHTTGAQVERVLGRERQTIDDLAVLLSAAAIPYLETMAQRAAALTRAHFGNSVLLFTPLYIANYCDNACPYCSFGRQQAIGRKQLTLEQIRAETGIIAASGIRHILVLTGESRQKTTIDYIATGIESIAASFSSTAIEIYPLTEAEYGRLIAAGVDGLTIYQEAYDEERYRILHHGGPKADYLFRLDAPERACRQAIRSVTIGALLGLADPYREALYLARHLRYLQDTFPSVELSVAFPRLRPLVSEFQAAAEVSDRQLVQIITAFRLVFPTVGITMSTRESAAFRRGTLPLGVTKISAGVSTAVGGHSDQHSHPQFEIADTRSVEEVYRDVLAAGFQPVMHDWHHTLGRSEMQETGVRIE